MTCDVCGQPATIEVADLVDETAPADTSTTLCPIGIVRAGCAAHPVASRTYQPGDVPRNAPWWTTRRRRA